MSERREFLNNKLAKTWDSDTGSYTEYGSDGVTVIARRSLTPEETAVLAVEASEATRTDNQATIMRQAQGALTANATYLAAGQPTNAQVVAQVRALTQQNNRIIRLLLSQIGDRSQLDATS